MWIKLPLNNEWHRRAIRARAPYEGWVSTLCGLEAKKEAVEEMFYPKLGDRCLICDYTHTREDGPIKVVIEPLPHAPRCDSCNEEAWSMVLINGKALCQRCGSKELG